MAVALLKFSQGPIIGTGGWALLGTLSDGPVQIANDNNTGVGSWVIELLDAAPGSALVPGVLAQATSSTPMASFQPDVPGSYRIKLTITGLDGIVDVDIRVFSVPLPGRKKVVLPPLQSNPDPLPPLGSGEPGEKPDELNFFGQNRGWAGKGGETDATLLHKVLIDVNNTEGLPDIYAAGEGETIVLREYPFKEPITLVYDGLTAWAIDSNWSTPVNELAGVSGIDTEDNKAQLNLELGVADERFDGGVFDGAGGIWLATSDVPTTTAYVRKFTIASKTVGTRHQVHTEVSRAVAFGSSFLWHLSATQLTKVTPSSPGGPYTTLVVTNGADLLIDAVTVHYGDAQPRVWVADAGLPGVRRASTVPAFDDSLNLASTTPKAITKSNLFVFLLAVDTAVNQAKIYRIIFDPVGLSTASNSIEAVFNVNGGGAIFDIEYDSVTNRLYVYGKDAAGDGKIARVDPSSMNVESSQVVEATLTIESSGALPRISVFKGSVWVPVMNPGGDGSVRRAVSLTLATQTTVSSFRRPEFDATGSTPSNANPQNVASATPSAGVSGAYSRADHIHAHGSLAGGTLHAEATQSIPGFLSAADKTKLDSMAAADEAPQAISTSSTLGASTQYAREDHVHAHGNLAGGTLHANAVSGGTAGFMTGVDKQLIDEAGETATVGRLVKRVTTGAIRNIMGAVGENVTGGFYLSNPTAAANESQQDSPAIILSGSVWDTAASRPIDFALQVQGVQGSPGQPGLEFLQQYNGGGWVQALRMYHDVPSTTSFLRTTNNMTVVASNALSLVSENSSVHVSAGGDLEFSGDLLLFNTAAGDPTFTVINGPSVEIELNEDILSFSIGQAQHPSASGATMSIRAQRGFGGGGGFNGGSLTLGGGDPGVGGVNLAGHTVIQLGQENAASSASLKLVRGATDVLNIYYAVAGGYTRIDGPSAGGLYLQSTVGIAWLRGQTTVGLESATGGGISILANTISVAAPTETILSSMASYTLTHAQDTSGPGGAFTIRAQRGFAGFAGGDFIWGPGNGGTLGSNLPGNARLILGTPVGGATAIFRGEREDGTQVWNLSETASGTVTLYFGAATGTANGVVRGNSLNLESNVAHVAITSPQDVYIGHGTGRDLFFRESGVLAATFQLRAAGLTSFTFANTVTGALFAISSTTGATGANIEMQAQSSTHAAGTGGLSSVTGGGGTTRGGHALLAGGGGTTNGGGGLAVVRGGAKAGTGLDGNVALHSLPGVVPTWGERVTVWGVATSEPTANPTTGYMLLWNTNGWLRARSNNGILQDVSWEDTTAGGQEKSTRKIVVTDSDYDIADTTFWTDVTANIPASSVVHYIARIQMFCTSGTDAGESVVVWRQTNVNKGVTNVVMDTAYDTETEQRMFPDGANFAADINSVVFDVNSNNVRLQISTKTDNWHITAWILRVVTRP